MISLIHQNVDLEIFDVSGIYFSEVKSVTKIAKALQKRTKLIEINMHCVLTNSAADAIAAILSHNNNMNKIILSKYDIEISKSLREFCHLNADLEKQEAYTIAALLSNCKSLEIFDITPEIQFHEENAAQAADVVRIFKSIKHISTLKIFCISCCEYADKAASTIADILANNKQLQEINFSSLSLKPFNAIKFFDAMKNLTKPVTFRCFTNF